MNIVTNFKKSKYNDKELRKVFKCYSIKITQYKRTGEW